MDCQVQTRSHRVSSVEWLAGNLSASREQKPKISTPHSTPVEAQTNSNQCCPLTSAATRGPLQIRDPLRFFFRLTRNEVGARRIEERGRMPRTPGRDDYFAQSFRF